MHSYNNNEVDFTTEFPTKKTVALLKSLKIPIERDLNFTFTHLSLNDIEKVFEHAYLMFKKGILHLEEFSEIANSLFFAYTNIQSEGESTILFELLEKAADLSFFIRKQDPTKFIEYMHSISEYFSE